MKSSTEWSIPPVSDVAQKVCAIIAVVRVLTASSSQKVLALPEMNFCPDRCSSDAAPLVGLCRVPDWSATTPWLSVVRRSGVLARRSDDMRNADRLGLGSVAGDRARDRLSDGGGARARDDR